MLTPSVSCAVDMGPLPDAFEASGGAVIGSELADLLRLSVDQPISLLARWIVSGQVVTFAWQSNLLLPLFQFDFTRAVLRDGLGPVLAALSSVQSEPRIALWFASPNSLLAGAKPADALANNASAVLAAAQADCVAAGGSTTHASGGHCARLALNEHHTPVRQRTYAPLRTVQHADTRTLWTSADFAKPPL